MRTALTLALCLVATAALSAPRGIEEDEKSQQTNQNLREAYRTRLNQNAVTIMAGSPGATDLQIVHDIAAVLDDGDNLRVLPMVGKGAAQTVRDVMFMRGVDMGVTHANVLKHLAKSGELGTNLNGQIAYVAKLFNEEMHVVARHDVASFEQLRDQPVSFGEEGSGSQLTGRWVFEALGVPVKEVALGAEDAIERVKRGELAAAVVLSGKPSRILDGLSRDQGLKLLPVPYPAKLEDYYPAALTHADYPALIGKDETVDTLSVCALLAVFNWDRGNARYKRVAKFVDAFFSKFDRLLVPPRHPKWREVNFAAVLEDWQRAPAAQSWIDAAAGKGPEASASQRDFEAFLAGSVSGQPTPEQREVLFKAFTEWSSHQKAEKPVVRAKSKQKTAAPVLRERRRGERFARPADPVSED